jgi:hypothetical protein
MFDAIWNRPSSPFSQARVRERAYRLALSFLACLGRHTITGLLCAAGRQFVDWSADYRLFSNARWSPEEVFAPVLEAALEMLDRQAPLVAALDDTYLKKTGAKIPGVGYRRDPMSPPFHPNFIRAQRFCQLSAMIPDGAARERARAIPIRYEHVPPVAKPRRGGTPDEWREYRHRQREGSVASHGLRMLCSLRDVLDAQPTDRDRQLIVTVDGSYCNGKVIKGLPASTTLIGRIRHDAKLFYPPTEQPARGRPRLYGMKAPTPEQLRQDAALPWIPVDAYAAGKTHRFEVKRLRPVLWRKAGADLPLQLVVVRPLRYRPSMTSRVLYRRPAYLVCTDPDLSLSRLLQYYLWRWDIEVNHRDEKQIIGVGQAQVRSAKAVERVPAFAVAVYATLLLASARASQQGALDHQPPRPKWRRGQPQPRIPTQQLLHTIRSELWRDAIESRPLSFSHFVSLPTTDPKYRKPRMPLEAALLYATS